MKLRNKALNKQSDEELMALLGGHHAHTALVELHRRYSKKLLGYFYRMLNKDEARAQDFVQDIFLKLMEKQQLFDPGKKFYTWIFTIAANMCKTAYRVPYSQPIPDDGYGLDCARPDDNLAEKEYFRLLFEKSLDKLEDFHKSTFVLRYMEHFSLREIAEISGVSLGTVKSRLFYATRKMAEELKEYNPKYETNLFKLM